MANHAAFWNQLLDKCDAIGTLDPRAGDAREQLALQLQTVAEGFAGDFDPAEDFEEYVAVALCQSINRILSQR